MGFSPLNNCAFWSKSRKINPEIFDGKMLFNLGNLAFSVLYQTFEIDKIHFDLKVILVCVAVFFPIQG